ncbi:glycerophosphodiester phosphodiesterase family protein [Aestuariivirga sp.]|uniref:glycerophosphodiester phosphodiesterase family protein n=1 Tax=Aestuariivirga sp. TaxID=2650926 RepID=UPI0025BB6944|nr:glycerophosphodiester phosphodiesterase family protein [Aestuariivirga sp.]MCA3555519.1 glycerophosphodiester phosphodiesterase [Aestuariivirga sp.]
MTSAFEIQGHRGARGLFPENTLEGFRATLALGVTSLELDVGVTADDVVVVVHDPRLNADLTRGPDGAWLPETGPAIRSLTYAELIRYDVGRARGGSVVALHNPDQAGVDNVRIPMLDDVFKLAAGTGVIIDVEIKTDPAYPELTVSPEVMADAVLAVARRNNALDTLAVRSFDWRSLAHLRSVWPGATLGWLTSAGTATPAWRGTHTPALSNLVESVHAATGGTPGCWAPDMSELTPDIVVRAKAAGLRVVPWTVNDPADIDRLAGWGVDGVTTDRPDLAREVLAKRGWRLPPIVHASGGATG